MNSQNEGNDTNAKTVSEICELLQGWDRLAKGTVYPIHRHPLRREYIENVFKAIENDKELFSNRSILESTIEFLSTVDEYQSYAIQNSPSLMKYPPFLLLLSNALGSQISDEIRRKSDPSIRHHLLENVIGNSDFLRSKKVRKKISKFIKYECDDDPYFTNNSNYLWTLARLLNRLDLKDVEDVYTSIAYCILNSKNPGDFIKNVLSVIQSNMRKSSDPSVASRAENRYRQIVENPYVRDAIKERILSDSDPYRTLKIRDNDMLLDSKDFAECFARKISEMDDPTTLMFGILDHLKYNTVKSNATFLKSVARHRNPIADKIRTSPGDLGLILSVMENPIFASTKSIQKAITGKVDYIIEQFWEHLAEYTREIGHHPNLIADLVSLAFSEYDSGYGAPISSLIAIMKSPYLVGTPRMHEEYNSKPMFKEAIDIFREKLRQKKRGPYFWLTTRRISQLSKLLMVDLSVHDNAISLFIKIINETPEALIVLPHLSILCLIIEVSKSGELVPLSMDEIVKKHNKYIDPENRITPSRLIQELFLLKVMTGHSVRIRKPEEFLQRTIQLLEENSTVISRIERSGYDFVKYEQSIRKTMKMILNKIHSSILVRRKPFQLMIAVTYAADRLLSLEANKPPVLTQKILSDMTGVTQQDIRNLSNLLEAK